MQIELPDSVVEALRGALTPIIERLIDEKVEQRRPLLLSVSQPTDELGCSHASVYGLIRGAYLEAIATGRNHRLTAATLYECVEERAKPSYEPSVVSGRSTRSRKKEPPVASTSRSRNQQMATTSVLIATKPPRPPRSKPQTISKQEIAERRCTIAEFAEQWYPYGRFRTVARGVRSHAQAPR